MSRQIEATYTDHIQEMGNKRLCDADNRKSREAIAAWMGVHNYVRLNPRQYNQRPPPNVICQKVSAIVGASWQDLNRNFSIVSRMIKNRAGVVSPDWCLCSGKEVDEVPERRTEDKIQLSSLTPDRGREERKNSDKREKDITVTNKLAGQALGPVWE